MLYQNLKFLAKLLNKNLNDLAPEFGMSEAGVYKWIKHKPGDNTLRRIASYFTVALNLPQGELRDGQALHLHSLRHTFASHLVMAGENLFTVSKLLGHSELKTTEIYAHIAPDHLMAAAEKVSY
jgi:integrase